MAFDIEAVILAEVGLLSNCVENYDKENNAERLMTELDPVEEKKERARIWTITHNRVVASYYNKKFWPKIFKEGDLVLKKVLVQEPGLGWFGPKCYGLFKITRVARPGTYRLADLDGTVLGHPWNADHFKRFYQ